ncbi:MAG: electron transport complex subunit RsxC [Clostridia bacterium]|nr:electron transport complex subunit RsxC [Clostridia bacterium]
MLLFKLGKTKVPHYKNTAEMASERMNPPASVLIPTVQHIGAPATPVVKVGDTVYVGTLIAEASGYVSAPVHSSVSGTVKKIDTILQSNGKKCDAILIESDGQMTPDPNLDPPTVESFEDLSRAARNSGLVGLGGAGFPTSVKLDPKKIDSIDTLVLNGAECEPYITSDTRTMLENANYIKAGVELIQKFSKIKAVVIGVEKNKPQCIEKLREVFAENSAVTVVALPDSYPQGAEKVLIYNSTGRVIPEGGLPSDVGIIVMNVTSIAYLAKYVETGMPLVEKCVTVDGSAIATPKNLIVPVGTAVKEVINAAGGFKCEPKKVLFGGPMMGVAIYSLDDPIMKNCNAVVALNEKDATPAKQNPCIHCGRCVRTCPMGLNPTVYARTLNVDVAEERIERFTAAKLSLCIECGSCSFVCPSKRPLVENNRLAKFQLREYLSAQQKKNNEKKEK